MGAITSQITSLMIVYSTVYSDADQRKLQSSASLALRGEFPSQMANNAENDDVIWNFAPNVNQATDFLNADHHCMPEYAETGTSNTVF